MDAPLREYGESLVAYRVRTIPERLLARNPNDPLRRRFSQRVAADDYFALFYAGYLEGLWTGGSERLVAWKADLETTLRRLVKLLTDEATRVRIGKTIEIGIATGLYEFFGRPLLESDTTELRGISPATADAVDQLEILHGLAPVWAALTVFENKRRAEGFAATLGEFADSVAAALVESATDQLRAVLLEEDANRQGVIVGRFFGGGVVELIRMVAEPPELAIVDLVSLLALDPQEQAQLGITPDMVKVQQ